MTKRFTDIEYDYENARIKCKVDGYFMTYLFYDDSDEYLPSLGDLLNSLDETLKIYQINYEQLLEENKELKNENEQLKQFVNNFKDTIIKITIAYQRKYDRTIVKLVNEVYDEDISDLIKELKK